MEETNLLSDPLYKAIRSLQSSDLSLDFIAGQPKYTYVKEFMQQLFRHLVCFLIRLLGLRHTLCCTISTDKEKMS